MVEGSTALCARWAPLPWRHFIMNIETPPLCSFKSCSKATDFCCCRNVETFLCEQHLLKHLREFAVHDILPISVYGQHRIPGYFHRLKQRTETRPLGIQQLESNLSLIDTCIDQLSTTSVRLIKQLKKLSHSIIRQLKDLKLKLADEIQAAVMETESTRYLDDPDLQSPISRLLREFVPGSESLALFRYAINPWQVEEFVKYEVDPSIHSVLYAAPTKMCEIPQITGNVFRYLNLETGVSTYAKLSETFNFGTVFCQVNEGAIVALGSAPASQTAFWLKIDRASLTTLPKMAKVRQNPGVIKHADFVYAFGGYRLKCDASSSAEKYSLVAKEWTALPNMSHPRSHFNPCSMGGIIFLADVSKYYTLDTFNPATDEITPLPIQLPESLKGRSVAFVTDNELTIVALSQFVGRWRQGESGLRVIPATVAKGSLFTNVQPVRVGRNLFWVRAKDGKLVSFNLDSNTSNILE